jgi:hypothetical protein
MKNLIMKVVVNSAPTPTNANGFYYREEHEWRDMNKIQSDWMTKKIDELLKQAASYSSNKRSDGLTATFSGTQDGVVIPDKVFTGFSYSEVADFEGHFLKISNELNTIAKGLAKAKDQKRGWK